jgi:hypothetical protein
VYAEFSRPVSISSGGIISVPFVLTHNKYSLSIKTTGKGFTFNVRGATSKHPFTRLSSLV